MISPGKYIFLLTPFPIDSVYTLCYNIYRDNEQEVEKMKKELTKGENYGSIFGLTGDNKMIYNGGISWTAIKTGKEMTMDSQATTNKAIEYINRAVTNMGNITSNTNTASK